MRTLSAFIFLLFSLSSIAQTDTTVIITENASPVVQEEPDYVPVFSSPRLINANTVEMVPKGILEFKVTHNFGDIGGDNGGAKNFFGLDNASDIRIGFQYGAGKNLNLVAARAKGAGAIRQLYELGIKYRLMRQANDSHHPFSLSLYANNVISAMKESDLPDQEHSFDNFSDRWSQAVQLMLARRMGKISLQLNPTLVHHNYVMPGDQNTVFAMGGAVRIPVKGRFSLLADYFHSFHNDKTTDLFKDQGITFHDVLGIGIELLTEGHVFHLNFTNATEILENRFIPRTATSWGDGEFRWGFTVSRDFNLPRKKRNKDH